MTRRALRSPYTGSNGFDGLSPTSVHADLPTEKHRRPKYGRRTGRTLSFWRGRSPYVLDRCSRPVTIPYRLLSAAIVSRTIGNFSPEKAANKVFALKRQFRTREPCSRIILFEICLCNVISGARVHTQY